MAKIDINDRIASHQMRQIMANPNAAVQAPINIGTGVLSGSSISWKWSGIT